MLEIWTLPGRHLRVKRPGLCCFFIILAEKSGNMAGSKITTFTIRTDLADLEVTKSATASNMTSATPSADNFALPGMIGKTRIQYFHLHCLGFSSN